MNFLSRALPDQILRDLPGFTVGGCLDDAAAGVHGEAAMVAHELVNGMDALAVVVGDYADLGMDGLECVIGRAMRSPFSA